VSKNVAVFVDVANILYAAKAAGADIDYITLLKSAVAGRDFVRAYAYTGLDPENENQRQFHSFLARNGYKVVSKDIRKYGDGRIKANLDIELVVDMMRTSRNLDIAVVVSGDGDFAPAIRAVQQMGVRVEVISFRGNTSSDLIEVADQFIDIAQIARVEKDSGRSGRRVAAEGDLSMTEVPEKETEGAPRRRRGGRGREQEREERVVAPAEAAAAAGGLTMLPGERLSRVVPGSANGETEPIDEEEEAEVGEGAGDALAGEEIGPDGGRRRRRRGGRGRGRGRRPEGEAVAAGEGVVAGEEDEDFDQDLVPPPPPHQAFGSVWDSQLGVPSANAAGVQAGMPPVGQASEGIAGDEEDEDLEEPEIPEYLLAERRQRGHVQRGRMGRGRGAYQVALDRERFGRGTPAPATGFGANAGRVNDRVVNDRPRPDRGRGGRPPRQDRPRFDRPAQGPRPPERQPMPGGSYGSDPWSEVPPDLEEMLRAELARKVTVPPSRPAPTATTVDAAAPPADAVPKRGRPRRTPAASVAAESAPEAVAEAAPKRITRTRTAKASVEPAHEAVAEPAPKRTTRARTAKPAASTSAAEPTVTSAAADASADTAAAKPVRRRRTAKSTEAGEGTPE
jgi:uncharacterized LabA/DUF88 family protein